MSTTPGRHPHDGPPRFALIAAILVASIAVVCLFVIVWAERERPQRSPVPIGAVPAPQANDEPCRTLLDALPNRLGDYRRATLAQPAPPSTAAWRRADHDGGGGGDDTGLGDVVVLRCGLEPPDDYVAGTPVQMVDDVSWLRTAGPGATTWTTVDRPVFTALTLPDGSGPSPIQLVSEAVSRSMPVVAVVPRPAR